MLVVCLIRLDRGLTAVNAQHPAFQLLRTYSYRLDGSNLIKTNFETSQVEILRHLSHDAPNPVDNGFREVKVDKHVIDHRHNRARN